MIPVDFPQANNTLGKPADMTDEQCLPLPVHHYQQALGSNPESGDPETLPAIISCWKLSPEELEEINRTGVVWVNTLGRTLAPFSVFVKNPFVSE
jgi:hypothetical protein